MDMECGEKEGEGLAENRRGEKCYFCGEKNIYHGLSAPKNLEAEITSEIFFRKRFFTFTPPMFLY
jgi:hypothetical protein